MLSVLGKTGSGGAALADLGRRQMAAALAVGRHSEAVAAARRWRRATNRSLALHETEALLSLLRFGEALVIANAALRAASTLRRRRDCGWCGPRPCS